MIREKEIYNEGSKSIQNKEKEKNIDKLKQEMKQKKAKNVETIKFMLKNSKKFTNFFMKCSNSPLESKMKYCEMSMSQFKGFLNLKYPKRFTDKIVKLGF